MSTSSRYYNQARSLLSKKPESQSHKHAKYVISALADIYGYNFKTEDRTPGLLNRGRLVSYPVDVHLWKSNHHIWCQVDGEIHVKNHYMFTKTQLRDSILSKYFEEIGHKYIVFKKYEVIEELDNNQILDRLGIEYYRETD